MGRILFRYTLRQYASNLMLGLVIFTFVLLLDRMFDLVDLILGKGVSVWIMVKMLVFLVPGSFSLTLPISNLLAALLTYGHLSETNEITAMRASGLSAWSYVQAPLVVALASVLFLIPFNARWAPHTHARFRQLYLDILRQNPLVRIEEKTFVQVGDYHVYAEHKERRLPRMTGVTIYKLPTEGAPLRIFAERGESFVDLPRGMVLTLSNGHIEEVDPSKPGRWFYTAFKTYILSIPLEGQKVGSSQAIQEMDAGELRRMIADLKAKQLPYPLFACELHLRWALAMTPVLFVGLGIPLAIRVHRGGRSIGFAVSLLIVVVYYVFLMGGLGFGQRGAWPPALAVWTANSVLCGAGAWLTRRLFRY